MKTIYQLIVLCCYCGISLSAHAAVNGEFNFALFQTPDQKAYIETYLFVEGKSLVFKKNAAGKKQAQTEVILVITSNNKVAAYDKYALQSEEIPDSTSYVSLLDLKRYSLNEGNYHIEIDLKDLNDPNATPEKLQTDFVINPPANAPNISDIMLIDSYKPTTQQNIYSKNGYDFVPNALSYYPSGMKRIAFYAELYQTNASTETEFLTVYYIKRKSDSTFQTVNNLRKVKRSTAQVVNVVLADFDINELPSGNYEAVVEIRNKKNELVARKTTAFQRSNTLSNELLSSINIDNTFATQLTNKQVYYYLLSLYPVAGDIEKEYIIRVSNNKDTTLMRQFLYNFWEERLPSKAEVGFNAYKRAVDEVQSLYGSEKTPGYLNDKGRVSLQYGKPDDIVVWDRTLNITQYPTEIWHYYKTNTQNNVTFVFQNIDFTEQTWQLVHSDVKGEINNPAWIKNNKDYDDSSGAKDNLRNHGMKTNSTYSLDDDY